MDDEGVAVAGEFDQIFACVGFRIGPYSGHHLVKKAFLMVKAGWNRSPW